MKKQGVNGIKAVLDAGGGSLHFNRLDLSLLNAVAGESRAQNLPIVLHTGDSQDVADGLKAGVNGIEHGSFRDAIPDELLAGMKRGEVAYDPTLSVVEGFEHFARGDLSLLSRPLLMQAAPPKLLASTRKLVNSPEIRKMRERMAESGLSSEFGNSNLLRAWKSGVMLVAGSDAGNPLVMHGPTVQRELELWVQAGIPNDVALQAVTWNAARLLRADQRFGAIRKGLEATLVIVNGNPLTDIHALSSITTVILKGERVSRSTLFDEE